jgi:hypothetical protein
MSPRKALLSSRVAGLLSIASLLACFGSLGLESELALAISFWFWLLTCVGSIVFALITLTQAERDVDPNLVRSKSVHTLIVMTMALAAVLSLLFGNSYLLAS